MKNTGYVLLILSSLLLVSTGVLSCAQVAPPNNSQQLTIQSLRPFPEELWLLRAL
jgi:hypothetical protein